MPRKAIVTIHGVNSTGAWQDALERILKPHFACLNRKYPDFKAPLGPFRACIGIRVAIVAFATAGLLTWWITKSTLWALTAGSCCGLLAGIAFARYRRQKVIERFVTWYGESTLGHTSSPHLIAHSFGTFICGSSIRSHATVLFDRVILVGAVIPRDFPWSVVTAHIPRKVRSVRNEVGVQDKVSLAAGFAPWITGMGSSGARGFKEDAVHTVHGPWESCDSCNGDSTSLVHNVKLEEFGHNEMFLSIQHAARLWLPTLWGITPKEYDDYHNVCTTANDLENQHELRNLAIVEAELRERSWSWTTFLDETEMSFEEFVEVTTWEFLERTLRELDVHLDDTQKSMHVISIASRAFRLIWKSHAQAIEELSASNPNHHILLAMHPRTAAIRAVDSLFHKSC